MTNHASCLCGEIKFTVDAFLPAVAHCHCQMCQKFHGAAFSTFAEVKCADFNWISGQSFIEQYRAENDTVRSFCKKCGSSLLFESKYNRADKTIEVALAVFDQPLDVKVNASIFCRSKVNWLNNDDIPQYSGFRE